MNTLSNLQQRYLDRGEVTLKPGTRNALFTLMVFGMVCFCLYAGSVLIQKHFAGSLQVDNPIGALLAAFLLIPFGIFGLIGCVFLLLRPFKRAFELRVTKDGLQMAGLQVPWWSIVAIESYYAGSRQFEKHVELTFVSEAQAPRVVSDDGSTSGAKLADTVNASRVVILDTQMLNVRSKTLVAFLRWVSNRESPVLPGALRFEPMP